MIPAIQRIIDIDPKAALVDCTLLWQAYWQALSPRELEEIAKSSSTGTSTDKAATIIGSLADPQAIKTAFREKLQQTVQAAGTPAALHLLLQQSITLCEEETKRLLCSLKSTTMDDNNWQSHLLKTMREHAIVETTPLAELIYAHDPSVQNVVGKLKKLLPQLDRLVHVDQLSPWFPALETYPIMISAALTALTAGKPPLPLVKEILKDFNSTYLLCAPMAAVSNLAFHCDKNRASPDTAFSEAQLSYMSRDIGNFLKIVTSQYASPEAYAAYSQKPGANEDLSAEELTLRDRNMDDFLQRMRTRGFYDYWGLVLDIKKSPLRFIKDSANQATLPSQPRKVEKIFASAETQPRLILDCCDIFGSLVEQEICRLMPGLLAEKQALSASSERTGKINSLQLALKTRMEHYR